MTLRRQVPPPPPPPEGVDHHLQQWTLDLEAWIRIKVRTRVRQAVMRYVLPGLLVSGLGILVAVGMMWADGQNDQRRFCEYAIRTRDNFRDFAFSEKDQWDQVLDLFPGDGEVVDEVRKINEANRVQVEEKFPKLTEETAGCP